MEPLISILQSDSDPHVRSPATTALGHLGDTRAREALLDAAHNGPFKVGLAAEEALSELGG